MDRWQDIDGWRDIASAPRDRTLVLLREGRRIQSGLMIRYAQHDSWCPAIVCRSTGEYSSAKGSGFRPTHWMPLPDLSLYAFAAKPVEVQGSK